MKNKNEENYLLSKKGQELIAVKLKHCNNDPICLLKKFKKINKENFLAAAVRIIFSIGGYFDLGNLEKEFPGILKEAENSKIELSYNSERSNKFSRKLKAA